MTTVEAQRLASGRGTGARGAMRLLGFAALSGLIGICAHLAGGGALPDGCLELTAVAGLAAATTLLAQASATLHRSSSVAFLVLGGGQLGIELVLQANDHALESPLVTLAVHLLANAALGTMLVGAERVLTDLALALDRVSPRLSAPRDRVAPTTGCRCPSRTAVFATIPGVTLRTPRGPPRRVHV